jgi:hypothetical protein
MLGPASIPPHELLTPGGGGEGHGPPRGKYDRCVPTSDSLAALIRTMPPPALPGGAATMSVQCSSTRRRCCRLAPPPTPVAHAVDVHDVLKPRRAVLWPTCASRSGLPVDGSRRRSSGSIRGDPRRGNTRQEGGRTYAPTGVSSSWLSAHDTAAVVTSPREGSSHAQLAAEGPSGGAHHAGSHHTWLTPTRRPTGRQSCFMRCAGRAPVNFTCRSWTTTAFQLHAIFN